MSTIDQENQDPDKEVDKENVNEFPIPMEEGMETGPRSGLQVEPELTTRTTEGLEIRRASPQNPPCTPPPHTTAHLRVRCAMQNEQSRERTFGKWPAGKQPTAKDLARAGFVYCNDRDRTQCVYCLGVVSGWKETDDPWREHARLFPICPFITAVSSNTDSRGQEVKRIVDDSMDKIELD